MGPTAMLFTKLAALGTLAVLSILAAACGGSKTSAKDPSEVDGDRSHGFSSDDRARCDWEGRADREVSEATASGAFQPNIRRVYQTVGEGADRRKILICREVDTNLDGVKDVMRTFNDKGEAMREEADTNYDGKVDSWISFANGRIVKHELDRNGDGKPDQWKFYMNGKLSRIQRDTNFDGKPDVWEIYVRGQLDRVGVDVDFDGRVDRWDRDEMARVASETKKEATANEDRGDEADKDDKDDKDDPTPSESDE